MTRVEMDINNSQSVVVKATGEILVHGRVFHQYLNLCKYLVETHFPSVIHDDFGTKTTVVFADHDEWDLNEYHVHYQRLLHVAMMVRKTCINYNGKNMPSKSEATDLLRIVMKEYTHYRYEDLHPKTQNVAITTLINDIRTKLIKGNH